MGILKNFFRNTSNILEQEFHRSSSIKNTSLKGQDREIFIQNFLTKSFPKKFVIETGEIIDSKDKKSKQADIVMYDEFMPVLNYGSSNHFLSGGVLSHIEIKSVLNSTELTKALNITKSIKNLNRDIDASMHLGDLPKKIPSFLFSYEGMEKETFKKKIEEFYKEEKDIDNVIDGICVLNKYVMLKSRTNEGKIVYVFYDTKEDSLMTFFGRLFDAIYKNWDGRPNLYKYMGDLNFRLF
ncbi:hypothetical protein KAR52_03175 [Candidatus Pacearchaeota archaeon]|nr:hypothetical protein [Candidatus Pacearchaeota archaeon]